MLSSHRAACFLCIVRKSYCYIACLFKVKFVQTVDIFMSFREPIRSHITAYNGIICVELASPIHQQLPRTRLT